MHKLLKTMVFALVLLAAAAAGAETPGEGLVVLIEPGMTEFTLEGESFLVVSTQRLRITFAGIRPDRIWGELESLDGVSYDLIKFLWTTNGPDPVTLHSGIVAGRSWSFDSDNVTGHNEKFE